MEPPGAVWLPRNAAPSACVPLRSWAVLDWTVSPVKNSHLVAMDKSIRLGQVSYFFLPSTLGTKLLLDHVRIEQSPFPSSLPLSPALRWEHAVHPATAFHGRPRHTSQHVTSAIPAVQYAFER